MSLKIYNFVTWLLLLVCINVEAGKLRHVHEPENGSYHVIDDEIPRLPATDKPQYTGERYRDDKLNLDLFDMQKPTTKAETPNEAQQENPKQKDAPDEDQEDPEDTATDEEPKRKYGENDVAFIEHMSNLLQAMHDHTLAMAVDLNDLNMGFLKSISQAPVHAECKDQAKMEAKAKTEVDANNEMKNCDNSSTNEPEHNPKECQTSKMDKNSTDCEHTDTTTKHLDDTIDMETNPTAKPSDDILSEVDDHKPTERLGDNLGQFDYEESDKIPSSRLTVPSSLARIQHTQKITPKKQTAVETDFDDYDNDVDVDAKFQDESEPQSTENGIKEPNQSLENESDYEDVSAPAADQKAKEDPLFEANKLDNQANINKLSPPNIHELWLTQQFKKILDSIDAEPLVSNVGEPTPLNVSPFVKLLSRSPSTSCIKPLMAMKEKQSKRRRTCSKETQNKVNYIRALNEVRLRRARQEQKLANARRAAVNPNLSKSPQFNAEAPKLESLIGNATGFAKQADRMLAEIHGADKKCN